MTTAKLIADKYIGRDGSAVGTYSRSRELTRAAVFAAQREIAAQLGQASPLTNAQMHAVLAAGLKAKDHED